MKRTPKMLQEWTLDASRQLAPIRRVSPPRHTLTGNADADTFQFIRSGNTAISDNTITDFELGLDTVTIEGVADSTYLNLIGAAAVTEVAGNAVLTLTTGDSITFEGISEADFESFFLA